MRPVRLLCGAIVACSLPLAIPADASACDCMAPGDTCGAYGGAGAVFAGRVLSIDEPRRVHMSVTEAFHGITEPTITLGNPRGGNNCDYPFKPGETYLVYAHQEPASGAWTSTICSRTRPLATAVEDLAYARRLANLKPGTPGRVDGSVVRVTRRGNRYAQSPLPRIGVTLTGESGTFRASTDSKGRFAFSGIPTGTYQAHAAVPDTYHQQPPQTVRVWDPAGCGTLTFAFEYDGRVSGRLVGPDGTQVAGVVVALAKAESAQAAREPQFHAEAWTGRDGRFEIRRVQPGAYVLRAHMTPGLAAGFVFYRPLTAAADVADAAAIRVDGGQRVALDDMTLPITPQLLVITAAIADEHGRPAEDAEVRLRDRSSILMGPPYRTGADGRFTFSVMEGSAYEIHATKYVRDAAGVGKAVLVGVVPFKADRGTTAVQVVVRAQH